MSCQSENMQVTMKVGATWGDPSFSGEKQPCSFHSESEMSLTRTCLYRCTPAPEFSEGLYVYLFNYEPGSTATICEVVYS